MRRFARSALVLACLLPIPGRARGDEFADFRIPSHRVLSWTGSLDGWGRRSTNDLATSRGRSDYLFSNAGSEFHRFGDGESGSTDLFLSADFSGERSSLRQSGHELYPSLERSFDQRSSYRSTGERWQAGYSFGRYIGRAPIALGADARALEDQNQNWSDSRNTSSATDPFSTTDQWDESNDRRRTTRTIASLRPRVGLGRVRDATGVYLARAIEERLRGDGILAQALTHDARQKLADLLALRNAYYGLHARPAKGMWAEIERVLREDGALAPGGLDASSTQRAGEPLLDAVAGGRLADGLPGTILLRLRGARAGAFVSGVHQRETFFQEGGSRSQFTLGGVPQPIFTSGSSVDAATGSDAVDAGLEAEWHRPVGLRVQLDAAGEASVPMRSQDDGLAVAMDGRAGWLVADRWYVQGSVDQWRQLLRNAGNGETRRDEWALALGGQVVYELQDHVTIQLQVRDTQFGERQPSALPPYSRRYSREQSATLGLTYRFSGRFYAPGFESLSRMMRPATWN